MTCLSLEFKARVAGLRMMVQFYLGHGGVFDRIDSLIGIISDCHYSWNVIMQKNSYFGAIVSVFQLASGLAIPDKFSVSALTTIIMQPQNCAQCLEFNPYAYINGDDAAKTMATTSYLSG